MPEHIVSKFTNYHILWLPGIMSLRYELIILMSCGLKGKQVNCITEGEKFLLLVIWGCTIWVWFNCSWKDGYKILEWLFRPSSKSSCGHRQERLEETEQAQSVPLFSETSRCRQIEPDLTHSVSGRVTYYRKKSIVFFYSLWNERKTERDHSCYAFKDKQPYSVSCWV